MQTTEVLAEQAMALFTTVQSRTSEMLTQKYEPEHTNSAISSHANKLMKFENATFQLCHNSSLRGTRKPCSVILRVQVHIFGIAFHLSTTAQSEMHFASTRLSEVEVYK